MHPATTPTKSHHNSKNLNKFLFCVRPVAMEFDAAVEVDVDVDPFNYVQIQRDDHGVSFSQIFPAPQKKRKDGKKFSRLLKAVWFETSLAKKLRNRKLMHQELQQPNAKIGREAATHSMRKTCSQKEPTNLNLMRKAFSQRDPPGSNINNPAPAPALRSSQSSSSISVSRTLPVATLPLHSNSRVLRQKQDRDSLVQELGKGRHSSNSGLCLVLVSLLVLVLWGKVCAIVCTSTWLFLVPRFHRERRCFQNGDDGREMDSVEYKKKIIMEGILERSHTHS